jgi:hypothetical protein
MGRSDNIIGDTLGVIPFRRVPFPPHPCARRLPPELTMGEARMSAITRRRGYTARLD